MATGPPCLWTLWCPGYWLPHPAWCTQVYTLPLPSSSSAPPVRRPRHPGAATGAPGGHLHPKLGCLYPLLHYLASGGRGLGPGLSCPALWALAQPSEVEGRTQVPGASPSAPSAFCICGLGTAVGGAGTRRLRREVWAPTPGSSGQGVRPQGELRPSPHTRTERTGPLRPPCHGRFFRHQRTGTEVTSHQKIQPLTNQHMWSPEAPLAPSGAPDTRGLTSGSLPALGALVRAAPCGRKVCGAGLALLPHAQEVQSQAQRSGRLQHPQFQRPQGRLLSSRPAIRLRGCLVWDPSVQGGHTGSLPHSGHLN